MYNILICDDEQIMIDSLQFIIRKNFEGQVRLFSALSGSDAIQICSSERIDIVFMDIHMPGMNGLEAISCILRLKPDAVIIVLSAFDSFQYAQEAMNLGAYKYITKPVNRNVVIQTVRNVMNLVDGRSSSDDEELLKKLDIVSPMVESDFIYSCIFNSDKNEDLSSYLNYFNLEVTDYFFICVEVPRSGWKNQYELCSKIRSIVSQKSKCLVGSVMANRIAVFVSVEISEHEDLMSRFHEIAREIYAALAMAVGQGVRAGISRLSSELKNVSACYNDALSALNSTSPNGEALFSDDLPESSGGNAAIGKMCERLLNRLKIGDNAGVQFLAGLCISEMSSADADLDKVKGAVFELLISAKNIVKSVNLHYENHAFSSLFSSLSGASDISSLRDILQNRLAECASAVFSSREHKENPVVKKVCTYIFENMSRTISLDDAAAVAGTSPFYLSKLFKEETGETFINYLTDKRLEKAKQLLIETDLSVKEITGQTGYNDQNYFSRLFKNKFGVSPTDFRNANGGGNS